MGEEYRFDGGTRGNRRVDLHVRSLSPGGAHSPQERVVDRLEQLDADGAIDAFTLTVWGTRFCPESAARRTDTGQFVAERIDAFEEWASRAGVSLDPVFETRETGSLVTEDAQSAIVLPKMLLVEIDGSKVHHVAPHVADDGPHTIADRLTTLGRADRQGADGAIALDSDALAVPSAGSTQD